MPRNEATTAGAGEAGALRFSIRNWVVLLVGVLAILAGYMLLAGGSTIAAPLLLVLGYAILIPLGIIL